MKARRLVRRQCCRRSNVAEPRLPASRTSLGRWSRVARTRSPARSSRRRNPLPSRRPRRNAQHRLRPHRRKSLRRHRLPSRQSNVARPTSPPRRSSVSNAARPSSPPRGSRRRNLWSSRSPHRNARRRLRPARRKSRRLQGSAFTRPARQFLLSFAPPVLVGALLTAALWEAGQSRLLPGTWLLLYGAGVVTGGAFSVRAVPLMGVLLIGVGAVALFWPAWGSVGMAVGFGGVQIVFGVYIARRHGG